MTTEVVSVTPETPLLEAAALITERNFTGVPVVDTDNVLVGLLTEYDLIEKGTAVHLPTLSRLLSNVQFQKDDKDLGLPEAKKILSLKVRDVMNIDPLTLPPTATIEDAVETFAHHHAINPVPIVDPDKKLVGILARFDIVRAFHAPHARSFQLPQKEGDLSDFTIEQTDSRVQPGVDAMLKNLQEDFIVVSRARARWWLVGSVFFVAVGFIIAFALILRLV